MGLMLLMRQPSLVPFGRLIDNDQARSCIPLARQGDRRCHLHFCCPQGRLSRSPAGAHQSCTTHAAQLPEKVTNQEQLVQQGLSADAAKRPPMAALISELAG